MCNILYLPFQYCSQIGVTQSLSRRSHTLCLIAGSPYTSGQQPGTNDKRHVIIWYKSQEQRYFLSFSHPLFLAGRVHNMSHIRTEIFTKTLTNMFKPLTQRDSDKKFAAD